jgi:hypothetical protein
MGHYYTLLTTDVHDFLDSNLARPFGRDALVRGEIPNGDSVLEHLIEFLQRSTFHFWDEEEEEDFEEESAGELQHKLDLRKYSLTQRDEVRSSPDIAILGTPVEIIRIDEIRRAVRKSSS